MTEVEERCTVYQEVINWINVNEAQFKYNCKPLYDKDNLKRIKRFANAPMEYIDERMELNKEVLKNYHKLHTSILLAGFTGLYVGLLYQSITYLVDTSLVNPFEFTIITWQHIALLVILLIIGPLIAIKTHITYQILKTSGLLKVIRDSEIEVYYLSKIKEYRKQRKQ